jgi:hypothetical protein
MFGSKPLRHLVKGLKEQYERVGDPYPWAKSLPPSSWSLTERGEPESLVAVRAAAAACGGPDKCREIMRGAPCDSDTRAVVEDAVVSLVRWWVKLANMLCVRLIPDYPESDLFLIAPMLIPGCIDARIRQVHRIVISEYVNRMTCEYEGVASSKRPLTFEDIMLWGVGPVLYMFGVPLVCLDPRYQLKSELASVLANLQSSQTCFIDPRTTTCCSFVMGPAELAAGPAGAVQVIVPTVATCNGLVTTNVTLKEDGSIHHAVVNALFLHRLCIGRADTLEHRVLRCIRNADVYPAALKHENEHVHITQEHDQVLPLSTRARIALKVAAQRWSLLADMRQAYLTLSYWLLSAAALGEPRQELTESVILTLATCNEHSVTAQIAQAIAAMVIQHPDDAFNPDTPETLLAMRTIDVWQEMFRKLLAVVTDGVSECVEKLGILTITDTECVSYWSQVFRALDEVEDLRDTRDRITEACVRTSYAFRASFSTTVDNVTKTPSYVPIDEWTKHAVCFIEKQVD